MRRRHFLLGLGAPALTRAAQRPPVKITRIRLAEAQGRFHKFVAMNSYDTAPKGHTYTCVLARIETDQGVEGVSVASGGALRESSQAALRELIGANPLELYDMPAGRVAGRAPAHARLLRSQPWLDGPLLDLVGKLTGKPVWRLLGEPQKDRVEAYDGTLYFSDIWFSDRGVRAVVEEVEEALKKGYRGVKLKVGRGWKWMERDAGLKRDIEVVNAARKAAGPEVKILADANDGYRRDFERAWRFMEGTAASNVYWIEEIFPEDVAEYTRFRDALEKARLRTLVAEGESAKYIEDLLPYIRPRRLVDVLQLDIRNSGIVENLAMARAGGEAGAFTVPHNWASNAGTLMGLHLAKASPHVPAAEDDRSSCDALIAEGYEFRNGLYTVPDEPGFGMRVNEKVYEAKCRAREIVI